MIVEIKGIDNCIYCDKARDLIGLGIFKASNYTVYSKEEMREWGYKTAPAVYLNGEYIGGYEDLLNAVAHQSFITLEALHLCGVKEWDGYDAAIQLVDEWQNADAEEISFEGEEL